MKLTGKLKLKKRKDEQADRYARARAKRRPRLPDYDPSGIELAMAAASLIGKMQSRP